MSGFSREEIRARGHPVWAEIDLAAIRHNIKTLKGLAKDAEVMGVVKGYAYGHGSPECPSAMLEAGVDRLGVARVAEAIHLREAGIEAPIHVFTEPPPEAAATFVGLRLTPTVYTEPFARALSAAATDADDHIPVHVKLDTGMHRVGLQSDEVPAAIAMLRSLPGLVIEGAWSHFAVADVPGHPFTDKQLARFRGITERLEQGLQLRYKHIANSAATISLPDSHFNLVRCGIAAYGLWPGPHHVGTVDLRPALALKASVNMVKHLAAGEALSYGLRYELEHPSKVATVAAGYADGYDRGLSGNADLLIEGRRHRVSGTVCMDQFMVDVGDHAVEPGSVVTLVGQDGDDVISAEELADRTGTINYEVTTRIPSRVPRIYLNRDAE